MYSIIFWHWWTGFPALLLGQILHVVRKLDTEFGGHASLKGIVNLPSFEFDTNSVYNIRPDTVFESQLDTGYFSIHVAALAHFMVLQHGSFALQHFLDLFLKSHRNYLLLHLDKLKILKLIWIYSTFHLMLKTMAHGSENG